MCTHPPNKRESGLSPRASYAFSSDPPQPKTQYLFPALLKSQSWPSRTPSRDQAPHLYPHTMHPLCVNANLLTPLIALSPIKPGASQTHSARHLHSPTTRTACRDEGRGQNAPRALRTAASNAAFAARFVKGLTACASCLSAGESVHHSGVVILPDHDPDAGSHVWSTGLLAGVRLDFDLAD